MPKSNVTVFLSDGFTQSLPKDLSTVDSVVLDSSEDELLQRIFERAQALSNRTVPPASSNPMLANAAPELTLSTEPKSDRARAATPVPRALVASDGGLKWGHFNLDFTSVTVGDFQRSRALGLIDADPSAFVFAAKDPIGNGFFLAWNDLQNVLITIGSVGGGVTFLGTAGGRVGRLIRRLRRKSNSVEDRQSVSTDYDASNAWLADFFERNHSRWVGRGALEATDFIIEVCRHKQWDAQTLAQVLQITLDESQTLLDILGYGYEEESGRHELSTRSERRAVRSRLLSQTIRYDPATNEILNGSGSS